MRSVPVHRSLFFESRASDIAAVALPSSLLDGVHTLARALPYMCGTVGGKTWWNSRDEPVTARFGLLVGSSTLPPRVFVMVSRVTSQTERSTYTSSPDGLAFFIVGRLGLLGQCSRSTPRFFLFLSFS